LNAALQRIGEEFDGDVGIAVRDIQTGWTSHFGGTGLYPQQSVSKLWVTLTALDLSDRGELDLSQRITLGPSDLAVFHQPMRELALRPGGYSTTLGDLMFRAITQSDNMANDVLLWRSGGPEAVRAFLQRKGITAVRFGPGERLLQSGIAGVDWKPEYSLGRRFYAARADVPMETRRALFEAYVADPVDGAAPVGVVDALARLSKGEILSASATDRVLSIMGQTRTGRLRLKAGLPAGWKLGHKTGTGQILGAEQAGYNDIGIITSPAGRSYAIAVFIGRTSEPIRARTALMHKSVRAVVSYERDLMRQQKLAAKTEVKDRLDGGGIANAQLSARVAPKG
jgi:beta-lactamase class A